LVYHLRYRVDIIDIHGNYFIMKKHWFIIIVLAVMALIFFLVISAIANLVKQVNNLDNTIAGQLSSLGNAISSPFTSLWNWISGGGSSSSTTADSVTPLAPLNAPDLGIWSTTPNIDSELSFLPPT
jgi:hypothetical protein